MRIIDADALIKQLKSSSAYNDYEWSMYADGFIEDIENAPTIEPKRGRWIPYKQDNGKTILWKCSECGRVIYSETETDRLEFNKWCSRCGADMREREGE